MRKKAVMFLFPRLAFNDQPERITVVGDISDAEYGRYLKMGCTAKWHTQYNKNGFPIFDGTCRLKAADVVGDNHE